MYKYTAILSIIVLKVIIKLFIMTSYNYLILYFLQRSAIMEFVMTLLIGSQLLFTIIAGLYFYVNLRGQQSSKQSVNLDSKREIEKLTKLRSIHLTKPLSEKTRPEKFEEIIGQEKGIKALKAALCGPNPQHVIIYGPPGIGKTAAARLVLEEAKKSPMSPFSEDAKFVEMDATILQFDERSIADPLIGSVHDPIYQGAGAYGNAGVPQPKPGAVTKAHGGVLFIDEIGELHQYQMNKLLKVLEDRKVFLTSSYYSEENKNIPRYIHDVFKNGLPADFRLIGATTRQPEEIPPALRSRCTEIFFRSLDDDEVNAIAANSCKKAGFEYDEKVPEMVSMYSSNGRDTVNIIQTASSIASIEKRNKITVEDIEEVIDYGRYVPKFIKKVDGYDKVGIINGLAVTGANSGILLQIEAIAKRCVSGNGKLIITGIVDEEEIRNGNSKIKRKGTARASIENVITVINQITDINTNDYNLHINFPGGMPVDGPSAGIAMFCAIYSAIYRKAVSSKIAMTGEISIKGSVMPVGGVADKIEGAIRSGADTVIIPKDNYQKCFNKYKNIDIITVDNIQTVINKVFKDEINIKYA